VEPTSQMEYNVTIPGRSRMEMYINRGSIWCGYSYSKLAYTERWYTCTSTTCGSDFTTSEAETRFWESKWQIRKKHLGWDLSGAWDAMSQNHLAHLFSWAICFIAVGYCQITCRRRCFAHDIPAIDGYSLGMSKGNYANDWTLGLYWKRPTTWLGHSQKRSSQRRTATT
jgi:hypothetical protein